MIVLSSIFYSVVAAWRSLFRPVWTGGMIAELPHSTFGPMSTALKYFKESLTTLILFVRLNGSFRVGLHISLLVVNILMYTYREHKERVVNRPVLTYSTCLHTCNNDWRMLTMHVWLSTYSTANGVAGRNWMLADMY